MVERPGGPGRRRVVPPRGVRPGGRRSPPRHRRRRWQHADRGADRRGRGVLPVDRHRRGPQVYRPGGDDARHLRVRRGRPAGRDHPRRRSRRGRPCSRSPALSRSTATRSPSPTRREDWERLSAIDDPFFSVAACRRPEGSTCSYVGYTGSPRAVDRTTLDHVRSIVASSAGSTSRVSAMRLARPRRVEDVGGTRPPGVLARLDAEVEGDTPYPSGRDLGGEPRASRPGRGRGHRAGTDLLAVAEDVRPASSAEWDDLARTAVLTPGPGEELVGSGEFSDGSPWALVVERRRRRRDRWTTLRTRRPRAAIRQRLEQRGRPGHRRGRRAGRDRARPCPSVTAGGGGGLAWAYGLLDPTSGAAWPRVVVEDASGAVVAEAVLVGEGDLRGWVVELPAGLVPPDDGSTTPVVGPRRRPPTPARRRLVGPPRRPTSEACRDHRHGRR